MLTDEQKDQIAGREVSVNLTLGEAGAVGVAIGQMMKRIEDGSFTSLVPLNQQSLYEGAFLFVRRLQDIVERSLSETEVQDLREFQQAMQAKGKPQ